MFAGSFWKSALERMVRAGAAAVLAALGGSVLDVLTVDWRGLLSIFIGAAIVSLLISLVSTGVQGSPGVTETPKSNVVALTDGADVVAGPASSLPNGESVSVQPAP